MTQVGMAPQEDSTVACACELTSRALCRFDKKLCQLRTLPRYGRLLPGCTRQAHHTNIRAPCGIRTHDLPLTERVLYQLS